MINFGSSKEFPQDLLKTKADIWIWDRKDSYSMTVPYYIESSNFAKIKFFPETMVGFEHHVLIFVKHVNYTKTDLLKEENFNACLIDPPQYISSLIDNGYSGLICKTFEGSQFKIDCFFDAYKLNHKKIRWISAYKEGFINASK